MEVRQHSQTRPLKSQNTFMDIKSSPLQVNMESQSTMTQDSALHQQALGNSTNGKYGEDIFDPSSSYRNNLNELGSIAPMAMMVAETLTNEQAAPPSVHAPTYYNTNRGQIYDIKSEAADWQIDSSDPGYQSFTISTSDAPQPCPAFVQCLQYYAPANTMVAEAGTGDVSAYQICSPTSSLPQGVAMASSTSPLHSSQQLGEEASRKRELRLMKNREAARECRRKKKEYVKCLENRVAVLENQNKTLIEELKALKDLYCRKTE
ncbi:cAMP responsive element modulator b isoform X1 [Ictalurus punctatus]|uniref:cAMP responsive element modulator b isoform X1 n=1 Tax=Ictalurus punctatus TaxID=7998 RepID=A0A2D0RIS4_ICTPU|nr:cAMP responsive element modulator b isoform X1 [Ictalurus punctatus]